MNKSFITFMIVGSMSLIGCASPSTKELAEIDMAESHQSIETLDLINQPQSTETPEEYNKILTILHDTFKNSSHLMLTSSEEIREKAINPVFEGEISGMKILTLMALGAEPVSITQSDSEYIAVVTLSKDNIIMAKIECLVGENSIRPTAVSLTPEGDSLLENNMEIIKTWATS